MTMFFQDTCLGSLIKDMITIGSTSPGKDCPATCPGSGCSGLTDRNCAYHTNNGDGCCSCTTLARLGTTECIDQVRSQPRFIYEVVRSDIRDNILTTRDTLVNRMIQLCGIDQVPQELGGTRVVRRKRSVNATSRIIPINQAFESSSGQALNTDLTFGKKTSKIV